MVLVLTFLLASCLALFCHLSDIAERPHQDFFHLGASVGYTKVRDSTASVKRKQLRQFSKLTFCVASDYLQDSRMVNCVVVDPVEVMPMVIEEVEDWEEPVEKKVKTDEL